MNVLHVFHRLLLRWSREHSHVLLACGYGLYAVLALAALTRAYQIGHARLVPPVA